MVTDMFGAILQELGHSLEISGLHPDQNHSCLIHFKNGLEIQLEIDRSGQFMVLGADLGAIPPGKYRENLFREALKANDMPHPTHGTLAYSKKSDHLILFERINVHELNGEKVAAEITPFSEKATLWSEALKNGEVPSVNQLTTSRSAGMFGLRP
jgi:hypothetical protein